ncbi:MAG: undecaprenyl-diphosphate phosphatase [Kiritimatiellae bacterium]|nr:undecaprenyl-diphosphate phosphatase [Kiritimatiellia bacterium]
MRDLINVMALAVLQGVTEFLPVSSSGHLVIAQDALGIKLPGIRLEVMLHLGTMLSIIVYYRETLRALTRGILRGERASWATAGHVALSAVPAVFFYVLFHDKVDAFYEDSRAVGGFLVFTGVVLCSLRWMRCGANGVTAPRALLVGMAQAFAVLPGVSRSGMTISAARMAGVEPRKAAEFSFLMCLPLLAGAAALDAVRGAAETSAALPWWLLLGGALVAAAVGYAALALLVRVLRGGKFWMFGIYCLAAGAATLYGVH